MDAISDSVAIAIPPLEPGRYRLSLKLYSAAGDLLGENRYEFHATQERVTPAIVGAGPCAHPLFAPQLNCGTQATVQLSLERIQESVCPKK